MLIPFPSVARTVEMAVSSALPQSVLEDAYRGERGVSFRLGYSRWRGSATIMATELTPAALAEMLAWSSQLADGSNFTRLPLGLPQRMGETFVPAAARVPAAQTLTVTAATGATTSIAGTANEGTTGEELAAAIQSGWLHDGNRLRLVQAATGSGTAAAPVVQATLLPTLPRLTAGAVLTERLYIEAGIVNEGSAAGPLLTWSPDWVEPVTLTWLERIG